MRGSTRVIDAVAMLSLVALLVPAPLLALEGALTLTVNSDRDGADASPGDGRCAAADGRCTLRAAVQESNASPGRGRIIVPAGFYALEIAGADEDAAATGDLDISDDLTLEGAGEATTRVYGNGLDGLFHVLPGVDAALSGLTMSGGLAVSSDGAGAVLNSGSLRLRDVRVAGNSAPAAFYTAALSNQGVAIVERSLFEYNAGGAIVSIGSLEIIDSVLRFNGPGVGVSQESGSLLMIGSEIADQLGTAMFCQGGPTRIVRSRIHRTRPGVAMLIPSGTVTVLDSVIEANEGGGINNDGGLRIERSTLRANSRVELIEGPRATADVGTAAGVAGVASQTGVTNSSGALIIDSAVLDHRGGGLVNEEGAMTLINVTVSGNSSTSGAGGVTNYEELEVRNSTITDNRALGADGTAGGLSGWDDEASFLRLSNTIVAGNTSDAGAPDCVGPIVSEGYNLIGDRTGCADLAVAAGDVLDIDAGLAPLADNGGPTSTHAPLPGSAALDAGSPAPPGSAPSACPSQDQRGAGRPRGAGCDIGAVEVVLACGDGILDAGETCDDGNREPGDCCSAFCRFEPLAGDCDGSGAVEVDDLVRAVGIALGTREVDDCNVTDADTNGRIDIAELVAAVQAAMQGCQQR